jgi:hypothetical protein
MSPVTNGDQTVYVCNGAYPAADANGTATDSRTDLAYQYQSAQIDRFGSTGAASVAISLCAQGANKLLEEKASGGALVSSCLGALSVADKLKEREDAALRNAGAKNTEPGLNVNPDLYNDPSFRKEEAGLRDNYGLSPKEFVNKTLATHGIRPAFGKIVRSRISEGELRDAIAQGDALAPEKREKLLGASHKLASAEAAPKPVDDHLRASLQSSLLSRGTGSDGVEATPSEGLESNLGTSQFDGISKPKAGFEGLHALEINGANDEVQELTLFDVVHLKYLDRELLHRLAEDGAR